MNKRDEKNYLKKVLATVHKKKKSLELTLNQNETDYHELKKYTVDYSHELDKYEVYHHQQNLKLIDSRSILESQQVYKLNYQTETPYFAKILFRFDGDPAAEDFYIGRYGLSDEISQQFVYDWRAPISALYYDFGIGKSSYQVSKQNFSGENLEKLQFDIQKGQLKNIYPVNEGMSDLFLNETLSQASSQSMKNIVQTIQKEQNEIIRESKDVDILIQGVAGSGKTSIALHRLAYLLYQELETLKAENILILSPNQIFSSYIANVLPELGEADLRQLSFEELAKKHIQINFKYSHQEELAIVLREPNSPISQNYQYKQNSEFEQKLASFLEEQKAQLWQRNLKVEEEVITKTELQQLFSDKLPVFEIIAKVSWQLTKSFTAAKQRKLQNSVTRELKNRLNFTNEKTFYQEFLQTLPEPYHYSKELTESDLFPLLYIRSYFSGLPQDKSVKYLVVDEMQDYSILQYKVLKEFFSGRKIYCGDIYQHLIPKEQTFLADLEKLLSQQKTYYLKKSYRSSYEIIKFAQQFVPKDSIEPVKRHGESVQKEEFTKNPLLQIQKLLTTFLSSNYQTCGIICQNESALPSIQAGLNQYDIQILTNKTKTINKPIVLTTQQYAKGLEFDFVILIVDKKEYAKKSAFIYIGATRALHKLTVLTE